MRVFINQEPDMSGEGTKIGSCDTDVYSPSGLKR